MSLRETLTANEDTLDQVAGITGLGWTASFLGYLSVAIGYSNTLIAHSHSLLYLGGVFLVATLGLDRLKDTRSNSSK